MACDGKSFPAHKVVLSACSPYFQTLFQSNPCKHPIVFLKDVKSHDMEALIEFIYKGEVRLFTDISAINLEFIAKKFLSIVKNCKNCI
ncbi:hypothetical protein HAZT_HAZT007775 [Hyalella azteca]|uniref:BTB domain-containing protein n=1 Tax=Hyalella azteca TaxID=294128 RepID=A0A6A0H139_HYAAZ|nr:hypothetical protein HAZT_HAZT007775 [Hyalella azteca]